MAGGALDTGLVTTSFANCMDLCAAWNADADKVKKSGKCGGVTWMVQGKQGENNLVCELKKAGVVWNAWSEGRRGVSALLDA